MDENRCSDTNAPGVPVDHCMPNAGGEVTSAGTTQDGIASIPIASECGSVIDAVS